MDENAGADRSLPHRRVAIVAGGTRGHIAPGLAVAEAYRAALPDVHLLFLGSRDGAEHTAVPARGFRFEAIPGAPMVGATWRARGRALYALLAGLLAARRVLRREGTEVVIGFGGYASAGALLAARSLGIACAIHESNSLPGLANRLLGRWVDRVYLSFDSAAAHFPAAKLRLVGIPVAARLTRIAATRQAPHGSGRATHLLITAGTLGSALFNRTAPDLARRLWQRGVKLEVRHQAGDVAAVPWAVRDARFPAADLDAIRAAYAAAGVPATVTPFIDDMAETYAWADVALSCGGTTLAELAATALPSIVVPLSAAAAGHQDANVRSFAQQTGAWWCSEEEWRTEVVADRFAVLCIDVDQWQQASQRLRHSTVSTAASDLVADCEALLAERLRS